MEMKMLFDKRKSVGNNCFISCREGGKGQFFGGGSSIRVRMIPLLKLAHPIRLRFLIDRVSKTSLKKQ
ncbi:hypothetical protein [Candidatus Soleaferrea massiliensis]|uniref:hypothetical protein n=1 Tax=Candidatus Soleaferrea massiliensis TaxID=1470354 RepID=UPI0012E01615|nr:hypothetical protein [Candidatus Soleaferrea massiliensis]